MAAFLGVIAFLLGVVVAVAGLFVLQRAGTGPRPAIATAAGVILLAAGGVATLATTINYLKYQRAGDFDHAYVASAPAAPATASTGADKEERAGARKKAAENRKRARAANGGTATGAAEPATQEHEAAHPDAAKTAPEKTTPEQ